MPTFGKEPCPFTGEMFARVLEGRGGTILVTTPVLREDVALQRELYEDLPGHAENERLGLRRWVADMIDAGTLPVLLTGEHLLNNRNHPTPSPEVKAYRLLGWMVMERREQQRLEQKSPDRKFVFDKKGVHGRHVACLVTESDNQQRLFDPLQRLQTLGFVEFLGANDDTVITPSLSVRLTPAGIENAGRPPVIHQASADFRATGQMTASAEAIPGRAAGSAITVARDTRPDEVEKNVIRTIDRTLVRDRVLAHGADLVAMADELLAQLERALEPDPIRHHNRPPEPLRDPDSEAAIERLRGDLQKFRDALAKAIAGPTPMVETVVKRGGRLVGALKAVVDHPIVQRPALGVAAVAVSALATAAGVPVDPTITIGLMLAGPEGAKAVGEAAKRIGGPSA